MTVIRDSVCNLIDFIFLLTVESISDFCAMMEVGKKLKERKTDL